MSLSLLLAALALPAALLVGVPDTGASGAGPEPTCRGRQATVVVADGERGVGTDGPDVFVVLGGGGSILAGGGDDLVCVRGGGTKASRTVFADRGDDRVHVTADAGFRTIVDLGPGQDVLVGGPGPEDVRARERSRQTIEHNVIRTGGGDDVVDVRGRGVAGDEVTLGGGDDELKVGAAGLTRAPDGGPGSDRLVFPDRLELAIVNNLPHTVGRAQVGGAEVVTWTSFERFGGGGEVTFRGSWRDEVVATAGDSLDARMGGGDDRVVSRARRVTARGGAGGDHLTGGPGDDALAGGEGTDAVDGRGGTDTCEAEEVVRCEASSARPGISGSR